MAARFCPQCGRELASTVQFCPACGASQAASASGGSKVEATADRTRRFLVPAMLAALVVLAIAVAVLAGKARRPITSAPQTAPAPAILSAPTDAPAAPAVTSAPTTAPSAPAVTGAPSRPAPTLPPDVAAYLKFLQGIEERRVALSNDTSGAMAMMQTAHQMQGDQSDPEQHNTSTPGNVGKLNQGYSDYTAKWNSLAADFRAVRAPAACTALANAYFTYLSGYVATISRLQTALLNGDMSAAMGVQGAQKQINADALAADGQLGQLCNGYGVAKPFSIQPEGGSSPLTGL